MCGLCFKNNPVVYVIFNPLRAHAKYVDVYFYFLFFNLKNPITRVTRLDSPRDGVGRGSFESTRVHDERIMREVKIQKRIRKRCLDEK